MKRLIVAAATGALIWAGSVAVASALGQPNINNANAQIQVKPTSTFKVTQCTGVNGVPYMTWTGSWRGAEAGPASGTYNLSGPVTVSNVVWTVNLKTDRGVLTGSASLQSPPPSGGPVQQTYLGPLTLITQGLPDVGSAASVPARGYIEAPTYTGGVKDGGDLLANVEFRINPGFSATGEFGDLFPSLSTPNYSVTTDNQSCVGAQKP